MLLSPDPLHCDVKLVCLTPTSSRQQNAHGMLKAWHRRCDCEAGRTRHTKWGEGQIAIWSYGWEGYKYDDCEIGEGMR